MTEAQRERMIFALVENEIKTIIGDHEIGDDSYVNDIFRMGFKGYDNFTDQELTDELKEQLG